MISNAAIKAGFGAGILEDDPDTKSLKVYLVLTVGGGDVSGTVSRMSDVDIMETKKKDRKRGKEFEKKGSKAWITRKKAQSEAKGKIVKPNSKFTGRRRKTAW
jgi:18S rRNA (guanine1575-N7)-methyltransferase